VQVIHRCLRKDPDEREPHAAALHVALQAIVDTRAGCGSAAASEPQTGGSRRARPVASWAMASVALLCAIGFASFAMWSGRRAAAPVSTSVHSIAILPFATPGGAGSAEMSPGLTEALAARLQRLPGIAVQRAPTGATSDGRESDPIALGRSLRADAIGPRGSGSLATATKTWYVNTGQPDVVWGNPATFLSLGITTATGAPTALSGGPPRKYGT
jgi:hypothetical protein